MKKLSRKKTFKRVGISILVGVSAFALFVLAGNPKAVTAQEEEALGVRISPPILEIEVNPGETYSDLLKVENLNDADDVTLYPSVMTFQARGEEGGKEFVEPEEGDEAYSLARWVNISTEELTLEPLEKIVLPFTISVPENVEPGGKYAAILLSNQPDVPVTGTQVSLGGKSGAIVLARIGGDVEEKGSIVEFSTDDNFYNYTPVQFTSLFRNTGNVHLKPTGKIEIKNTWGTVVDEIPVNESLANILPQSVRRFENQWHTDRFTLGKYNATLLLNFGEDESYYVTESVSFWVVPVKEVAISVTVLVVLILVIVVLVKRYNKWVIKKAMEAQKKSEAPKAENEL
jgi:hypothetical protein